VDIMERLRDDLWELEQRENAEKKTKKPKAGPSPAGGDGEPVISRFRTCCLAYVWPMIACHWSLLHCTYC
jgi:hypothetical protein